MIGAGGNSCQWRIESNVDREELHPLNRRTRIKMECQERDDFLLIVGNRSYCCPLIIADFLSPRLCRLHAVDCSVCDFLIETKDTEYRFGSLADLGFGHSIEIGESDHGMLILLCRELWNQEISDVLVGSDLTQANAIERLEFLDEIESDSAGAIGFIASNFWNISIGELKRLSLSATSMIVHQWSLKHLSEDSL
jgi:hypothetical protein